MTTKIMPLGIKVREIKKEVYQNGIVIIPESITIASKFKEGIVTDVGEGTRKQPMEVKVGERILYKKEKYPVADGCDIISMNEVLYVCVKKCKNKFCENDAMNNTDYCHSCYNEIFED